MSQTPYIAVVFGDGQMQSVIVQEWPDQIPLPRIAIVDYDINGVDEEDLTHFSIGDTPMAALCRSETPDRYEDYKAALSPALSPKAVLAALGEPNGPTHQKEVLDFPDWSQMARLELERRSERFLEVMPDKVLRAAARGEADLSWLAEIYD
jgi:hypothetical protein